MTSFVDYHQLGPVAYGIVDQVRIKFPIVNSQESPFLRAEPETDNVLEQGAAPAERLRAADIIDEGELGVLQFSDLRLVVVAHQIDEQEVFDPPALATFDGPDIEKLSDDVPHQTAFAAAGWAHDDKGFQRGIRLEALRFTECAFMRET
jgi:hypothetical protein